MKILEEMKLLQAEFSTRRHFLRTCSMGVGALAMNSLSGFKALGSNTDPTAPTSSFPHFAPKAKRVIYLHMAGSPSQLELFDYKPELEKLHQQLCPQSLLKGKRFAFINGTPKMLGPQATFAQHGESGAWVSANLPKMATVADEICFFEGYAHR